MPSPNHDAIIKAFRCKGADKTNCHRAKRKSDPDWGYTHVHGPKCTPPGGPICRNHLVTVERFNGTVSLYEPVALALKALKRQPKPISLQYPLGYSKTAKFGHFGYGFDPATILRRWKTFDGFADAVIMVAKQFGRW